MSKNIRNLAIDLVMNQKLEAQGIEIPLNIKTVATLDLPSGLSEEEYYQLLVERNQDK